MKLLLAIAVVIAPFISANAQKEVAAKEIFNAIDKNRSVQYDGVIVTGDLDLTELSNRKNKNEGKGWEEIKTMVEVPVVFRNCTFKGDVIAYKHVEEGKNGRVFNLDINYGGKTYSADFRENVVFENCTFNGGSEFKYSAFSKTANFSGSKFDHQANFKYAHFKKDAFFAGINFTEYANFKYADFSENAEFQNTRFRDNADFKYAEFHDKVNFTSGRFQRHADFKYADFNDGATFDKTDFEGGTDFKYSNGKRYVSR
ncbi:MAG: pentapeptide repeat-containing protein [Spirosomataceae bacterium]